MIVLHNNKNSKNHLVAQMIGKHFNCNVVSIEDNPCLDQQETVVFVIPNVGDEELPQPTEDYLYNLQTKNKKYIVCEIGNYFGFENYCGCKSVAMKLLDKLGWTKKSDLSLDSLPELDFESLEKWLKDLK